MIRKLLALLLCLVCISAQADEIIVATDLHYISPELTDNGPLFTQMIENGDGKLTLYSEEIVDAFFAEVLSAKPAALILTGDLTFNGALQSHRALAAKLGAVQEAGIPVLVLPGNHDVYNNNAAFFSGNTYQRVPFAASADFESIYHAFGFDGALSRDDASLSYVYELPDGSRVLMLDFNTAAFPCGYAPSTLQWVREQLQEGITLAAGHQNLMQHTIFGTGYVIQGAAALLDLLEQYHVPLFLSGHMHLQHISQWQSVTEIATSSLCVAPCQYGIVDLSPLSYRTRKLDMVAWAQSVGNTDENLQNFDAYAAEFMDTKTRTSFGDYPIEMLDYAREANRCYFSGRMDQFTVVDSLSTDWLLSGSFFGYYLASMEKDVGKNFTVWNSTENP